MLGKLLGAAVKAITIPVDIVEIGADMVMGGDGSKQSRNSTDLPLVSNLRDKVVDALEDIDK